jgi:hypothetical protein
VLYGSIKRAEDRRLTSLCRPQIDVFANQISGALAAAELRGDRCAEILAQLDNSWPFWHSLLPMRAERLPHTQVLFDLGVEVSTYLGMCFKHELNCPRPSEYSPQVQPMIPVPGHGTYPMGHAAQAYVVARLLHRIVAKSRAKDGEVSGACAALIQQAYQLAFRISENRIVAGVHFEVDLWAGRRLGLAIADAIAAFAEDEATVSGAPKDEALDLSVERLKQFEQPFDKKPLGEEPPDSAALSARIPLFKCAFDAALEEWK